MVLAAEITNVLGFNQCSGMFIPGTGCCCEGSLAPRGLWSSIRVYHIYLWRWREDESRCKRVDRNFQGQSSSEAGNCTVKVMRVYTLFLEEG